MKLINCAIILLFVMLFSSSAIAADTISNVKIVSVETFSSYSLVKYEPARQNNLNCADVNRRENYLVLNYALSAHADNQHGSLLSAMHLGKSVDFLVVSCTSSVGGGGIPGATTITLYADQ